MPLIHLTSSIGPNCMRKHVLVLRHTHSHLHQSKQRIKSWSTNNTGFPISQMTHVSTLHTNASVALLLQPHAFKQEQFGVVQPLHHWSHRSLSAMWPNPPFLCHHRVFGRKQQPQFNSSRKVSSWSFYLTCSVWQSNLS